MIFFHKIFAYDMEYCLEARIIFSLNFVKMLSNKYEYKIFFCTIYTNHALIDEAFQMYIIFDENLGQETMAYNTKSVTARTGLKGHHTMMKFKGYNTDTPFSIKYEN